MIIMIHGPRREWSSAHGLDDSGGEVSCILRSPGLRRRVCSSRFGETALMRWFKQISWCIETLLEEVERGLLPASHTIVKEDVRAHGSRCAGSYRYGRS